MPSILEQARQQGRDEGISVGRQIRACEIDEAHEQGRILGLAEQSPRWPWFLIGMMLGAGLIWWLT